MTLKTPLEALWNSINFPRVFGRFPGSSTLFTNVIQTVFAAFVLAEKILCGWQEFFTSTASLVWGIVLGYIGHTAEPPILMSQPRLLQVARGQNHIYLPPHYTMKPLEKQLYGGVMA